MLAKNFNLYFSIKCYSFETSGKSLSWKKMPRKGRSDINGRRRRERRKLEKRALAAKAKRAWQPVVLIERLDIRKLSAKNVSRFNTEQFDVSETDECNLFTNTSNFKTETSISELDECNPFTKITNFKTETSISELDELIPFTNTINFKTEMQDTPKADEDKPLSIFLKYKSELTIPNRESTVTPNKKEFKEKELKLLAVQRKMMVKQLRRLVNEATAGANNVTEPALDTEILAAPKPDKSNTIFLRNISELTQSNPQSAPTWH